MGMDDTAVAERPRGTFLLETELQAGDALLLNGSVVTVLTVEPGNISVQIASAEEHAGFPWPGGLGGPGGHAGHVPRKPR